MARYYRGNYRRSNKRNIGLERAKQHILDAKNLTHELGGTDQDVKKYLFSLSKNQLELIFDEYGNKYGESAQEYAQKTINKWRTNKVQMSGTVAERMFNILPQHMPLNKKYMLTESLWEHVSPSSIKTYCIGIDTDINDVVEAVKSYLHEIVIEYAIPEEMEKRFEWLSQGDVQTKQKLLNYLRDQNKNFLVETLKNKIPILIDHLNNKNSYLTTSISHSISVGKHEVKIYLDKNIDGIVEGLPVEAKNGSGWLWIILAFVILFFYFKN